MSDDDIPRGYYRAANGKLFKLQPGQKRPSPASATNKSTGAPALSDCIGASAPHVWYRIAYSSAPSRRMRVVSLGHALVRAHAVEHDLHALCVQPFAQEQTCFDVAESATPSRFVIGSQSSAVVLSATALCTHLVSVPNQFGPAVSVQWHPRENVVLLAQFGFHQPGRVAAFRIVRDGEPLTEPFDTVQPRRSGSIWCAAWNPVRENCFVVGGTRSAHVCVLDGGQARPHSRPLFSDDSDVFCAKFCTRGDVVFHGARDGNVRTFDLRAGPPTRVPHGSHAALMKQRSCVSSIVVESDVELLVASHFGTVHRWDLRTCRATPECITVPGHNPIQPLEMCATSDVHVRQSARLPLIATGASHGAVQLWPLHGAHASTKPIRTLPLALSGSLRLRFDNDDLPPGKLVALWSLSSGAGLVRSVI
jgi:hypothetical protein